MINMDIEKIYKILEKELKEYTIPLAEQIDIKSKNSFYVLIGTMLSARTKDQITAKVCDNLFKEIKNTDDLIKIKIEKLEQLLYPVGFYKTKAKNLKLLAKKLKEDFNNKVPRTIEELITLPGVGRKTANLVIAVSYKIPAICVDTHVHRIFNRIGYIETKNPLETEMVLRNKLPKKFWIDTNYLFVILGQNICFPRNPNCEKCPINKICLKKIK
ncbi:endonuclease III [archaeon]|nr:endonuclease III [archaeon]NCP79518.1 endonuclease III [archaeon]NCP97461.1 endonuclease III [archaeon]NCQ07285.1 endonuclease III [archaeon]NCQ51081.1 endonuclease III [archaeon]